MSELLAVIGKTNIQFSKTKRKLKDFEFCIQNNVFLDFTEIVLARIMRTSIRHAQFILMDLCRRILNNKFIHDQI